MGLVIKAKQPFILAVLAHIVSLTHAQSAYVRTESPITASRDTAEAFSFFTSSDGKLIVPTVYNSGMIIFEEFVYNSAAAPTQTTWRTEYLCSSNVPICRGSGASLFHPVLQKVFFGSSGSSPRLASFHVPANTFKNHSEPTGNVAFVELVPADQNTALLPGSGVSSWNMDLMFKQNTPMPGVSFLTALCLSPTQCLLQARDPTHHRIYTVDHLASAAPTLVLSIPYSDMDGVFMMKRAPGITAVLISADFDLLVYDETNLLTPLLNITDQYNMYGHFAVSCDTPSDCFILLQNDSYTSQVKLVRTANTISWYELSSTESILCISSVGQFLFVDDRKLAVSVCSSHASRQVFSLVACHFSCATCNLQYATACRNCTSPRTFNATTKGCETSAPCLFPCTTCFDQTANGCHACHPSYYLDRSTNGCLPCHGDCKACSAASQTSCTSCATQGHYINYSLDICGPCAQEGWFIYRNYCKQCDATCLTCQGTYINCTTCKDPAGMKATNRGCITPALPNCNIGDSSSICFQCSPGWYKDSTTRTCISCTTPGTYAVNHSDAEYGFLPYCATCDSTCLTCSLIPTNCTSCKSPKALEVSGTSGSCSPCNSINNYIYTASNGTSMCGSCHTNCGSGCTGPSSTCSACETDSFLDPATSTCSLCDASCKTCTRSATNCASCAATLMISPSSGSCVTCTAPGLFIKSNLSGPSCESCNPACQTCMGTETNCTSCHLGFGLQWAGSSASCLTCNSSGFFCLNATNGTTLLHSCNGTCNETCKENCTECDASKGYSLVGGNPCKKPSNASEVKTSFDGPSQTAKLSFPSTFDNSSILNISNFANMTLQTSSGTPLIPPGTSTFRAGVGVVKDNTISFTLTSDITVRRGKLMLYIVKNSTLADLIKAFGDGPFEFVDVTLTAEVAAQQFLNFGASAAQTVVAVPAVSLAAAAAGPLACGLFDRLGTSLQYMGNLEGPQVTYPDKYLSSTLLAIRSPLDIPNWFETDPRINTCLPKPKLDQNGAMCSFLDNQGPTIILNGFTLAINIVLTTVNLCLLAKLKLWNRLLGKTKKAQGAGGMDVSSLDLLDKSRETNKTNNNERTDVPRPETIARIEKILPIFQTYGITYSLTKYLAIQPEIWMYAAINFRMMFAGSNATYSTSSLIGGFIASIFFIGGYCIVTYLQITKCRKLLRNIPIEDLPVQPTLEIKEPSTNNKLQKEPELLSSRISLSEESFLLIVYSGDYFPQTSTQRNVQEFWPLVELARSVLIALFVVFIDSQSCLQSVLCMITECLYYFLYTQRLWIVRWKQLEFVYFSLDLVTRVIYLLLKAITTFENISTNVRQEILGTTMLVVLIINLLVSLVYILYLLALAIAGSSCMSYLAKKCKNNPEIPESSGLDIAKPAELKPPSAPQQAPKKIVKGPRVRNVPTPKNFALRNRQPNLEGPVKNEVSLVQPKIEQQTGNNTDMPPTANEKAATNKPKTSPLASRKPIAVKPPVLRDEVDQD